MTSLFGKSTVQDLLHKELPSHPTSLPSFSCLSTFSNHASHSCSPTFLSHRSSSVWTSNTTSRLDNPANIYGSLQGNIATTKKAHTHTHARSHISSRCLSQTPALLPASFNWPRLPPTHTLKFRGHSSPRLRPSPQPPPPPSRQSPTPPQPALSLSSAAARA